MLFSAAFLTLNVLSKCNIKCVLLWKKTHKKSNEAKKLAFTCAHTYYSSNFKCYSASKTLKKTLSNAKKDRTLTNNKRALICSFSCCEETKITLQCIIFFLACLTLLNFAIYAMHSSPFVDLFYNSATSETANKAHYVWLVLLAACIVLDWERETQEPSLGKPGGTLV